MKKICLALVASIFSLSAFADVPRGQFDVSARNPFGVAFSNNFSDPITIATTVLGNWNYGSGQSTAAGDTSDPCSNYGNCPIGWAPIGALAVHIGNDFFSVGAGSDITLQPGQTAYFLMNDAGTSFNDNSGVVHVQWFCQNGCGN